jgi:hypothetical protein
MPWTERPIDYGSGIEYASGILQEQVSPVADSWLHRSVCGRNGWMSSRHCGGSTARQNSGALVRQHWQQGRPHAETVFSRVGYEFDTIPDSVRGRSGYLREACVLVRVEKTPYCRRKTVFVWHSGTVS